MKRIVSLVCVCSLLGFAGNAGAVTNINVPGLTGDTAFLTYGTWDGANYTLIGDTTEVAFTITQNGVTFDGAGYRISLGTQSGSLNGIFSSKANITIKNVAIENFAYGIKSFPSVSLKIENCQLKFNSWYGAWVKGGKNLVITNNTFETNRGGSTATATGLWVENAADTVGMVWPFTIHDNDFVDNKVGLYINISQGFVYNNNFIDNNDQIYINGWYRPYGVPVYLNEMDLSQTPPVPLSGNYWGDGANADADEDGIVDEYCEADANAGNPDNPLAFCDMNPWASPVGQVVDTDGDGVPDDEDICPGGDDNVNGDGDLVPDFCDPCPLDAENDADGDGVCGDVDVCPGGDDNQNADGDGLPDSCDVCPLDPQNDADGDGVCESDDNCPIVANPSQSDLDEDDVGDACDLEIDGDGVANSGDNCAFDANPGQDDFDGDGAGDVCDTDVDGDGVLDADDACVPTPVGDAINADGCSIGQLVPCEHPIGGDKWKNHGAYVSNVARTANDFLAAGLITEAEKDAIMAAAGDASCGKKN